VSWFINLLTGLIAILISAAMLHFGGDSDPMPVKAPVPASQDADLSSGTDQPKA
jgi:hypothetical protein